MTHYSDAGNIRCIQGTTTVSADMGDPTITGDGVKCGEDSICIGNECTTFNNIVGGKGSSIPLLFEGRRFLYQYFAIDL